MSLHPALHPGYDKLYDSEMKKEFKSIDNGWAARAGDIEVRLAGTGTGPSLEAYYSIGDRTVSFDAKVEFVE